MPVLRDGDVGLGDEALVVLEGAHGGLLPGGVPVEQEDDRPSERVAAGRASPAGRPRAGGARSGCGRRRTPSRTSPRRSRRRTGGRPSRRCSPRRRRPAVPRDLLLGQVDAVEHLRLLVDRRLGGVEVLGLDAVVVEQPAGAEADDVAGDVADRPDQPAAEPVVQPALAPPGQAGGDQLVLGERLAAQVTAAAPRPTAARTRRRSARRPRGRSRARRGTVAPATASPARWRAARRRTRRRPGCASTSRCRWPTCSRRPVRRAVVVLVAQLVAEPAGEPLDGLGEAEVVDLLDEGDDVAALAAAEAVPQPDRGADVEGRASSRRGTGTAP